VVRPARCALDYQYGLVGNLLAQTSADDPALSWQYRYDDRYRLLDASAVAGDWTSTVSSGNHKAKVSEEDRTCSASCSRQGTVRKVV
jgi:hypothetical protein